jgi:hypothetical protein
MASIRLKRFDLSFRTAYAQAKELALTQRAVPLHTPGTLQVETRKGSKFVYRYRYDASGKRLAEYIGPEGDKETVAKAGAIADEIRAMSAFADASGNLRKVGFYSADNSTAVTVARLFNAGIFRGGAILVGSHAFGALLNELGYSTHFPMTEDVDIARANRIEIAALPEGGFLALLRETGLPFQEVPELKRGAPSTSFKVRGKTLKVDLLVPSKGEPYRTVKVPELKAHATGLPFLGYLLDGPAQSVLIGRDRLVPILVPNAGRFCIHKLAVYALRSASDNPKRDKDAFQAAALAAALAPEQDFALREAIGAMDRTLRVKVRTGVRRALQWLGESHTEAHELLESIA